MHWWITEQAYRSVIVPTEKSKIDLTKLNQDIASSLREPIQGITREQRYDELEADSWNELQGLPGQ